MDSTQWALVIAALGILASPATAWLTYRWTNNSERARQSHELRLESARWEREDAARRLRRGEEAASELVTIIDRASIKLRASGGRVQAEFEPDYYEIRRLTLLLTDDATRSRMLNVADAVYFFHVGQQVEPDLDASSIAHAYTAAAHDVLRAYLLGRPCPETPRLARLIALIEEGGEWLADTVGEDGGPDPLGEPTAGTTT